MPAADPIALIVAALEESARVKLALRAMAPDVARVAGRVAKSFRGGGRLYACGNGGSACDAMHLVEELVARYKRDRPGLPAHHLLDAPTLTCWSNDYDFASAFRRQVEAMARPGDVLVAISTSGNSPNVVAAAEAARERGVVTLGLLGRGGGRLAALCTDALVVPAEATERIQEAHITLIHLLCELVERELFPEAVTDG
ncbi:D-sedoheptulose-7-phosphate isomerase [Longimicrobium sp.]|uniref:D-sedoheptulose-7-phosphate isomerase n=1 Tax=Longimicrobium sp. TaxID=2029185 RepID=UPI002B5A7AA0|nr:SIS domain-containing protein [Longimicrobium sp.]HSU17405.1 SIS domain-containing protein [Longimicrobium sp.]